MTTLSSDYQKYKFGKCQLLRNSFKIKKNSLCYPPFISKLKTPFILWIKGAYDYKENMNVKNDKKAWMQIFIMSINI